MSHTKDESDSSDLEQQGEEHHHLLSPSPTPTPTPTPRPLSLRRLLLLIFLSLLSILFTTTLYFYSIYHPTLKILPNNSAQDPNWPTYIGFEGPTPTGNEPLAAATSYPINKDTSPLDPPSSLVDPNSGFNILYKLGNLSPWRSVSHGLGHSPNLPSGCSISQIHLLHRHGARYPTMNAGSAEFAKKFEEAREKGGVIGSGSLEFLNDWSYQLGAEVLTPFGREQLFNLGVSFRTKYGALLPPITKKKGTDGEDVWYRKKKLVFRTESQDRMLKSALNFAAGMFGIPYEDQYHQLITIEAPGFNNTLAPYMTCPNAGRSDLNRGKTLVPQWIESYLTPSISRLQSQLEGYELALKDVYNMQTMCAYELVALGGSAFCELFSREEWEGYEYSLDLAFWYGYSFGQPAQAALGKGWVQEFLARVEGKKLEVFDSSTNSSYHTPEYFPLDQKIYVDATHDTVISAIITTLQFNSLTTSGPLPPTYIPKNLSFDTTKISPFAANLQAQVMTCTGEGGGEVGEGKKIRWLLNDGVVAFGHFGCHEMGGGVCDLEVFVKKTKEFIEEIDWEYDCLHPYELGDEPIMDGRPPSSKNRHRRR